jgi:hypothetical protein
MIKKLVAALGLFATVAYAGDSDAGCGVTLTFVNGTGETITIQEVESKLGVAPWATVYTSDFTIAKDGNATRAIELKAACSPAHSFRVKYKKGSNTLYETKGPVATIVDKKINITIQ